QGLAVSFQFGSFGFPGPIFGVELLPLPRQGPPFLAEARRFLPGGRFLRFERPLALAQCGPFGMENRLTLLERRARCVLVLLLIPQGLDVSIEPVAPTVEFGLALCVPTPLSLQLLSLSMQIGLSGKRLRPFNMQHPSRCLESRTIFSEATLLRGERLLLGG